MQDAHCHQCGAEVPVDDDGICHMGHVAALGEPSPVAPPPPSSPATPPPAASADPGTGPYEPVAEELAAAAAEAASSVVTPAPPDDDGEDSEDSEPWIFAMEEDEAGRDQRDARGPTAAASPNDAPRATEEDDLDLLAAFDEPATTGVTTPSDPSTPDQPDPAPGGEAGRGRDTAVEPEEVDLSRFTAHGGRAGGRRGLFRRR